ncbi:MAG: MFS transporter [Microbacterium sp.]|jgi:MFS family permease|uniref:MFS transporter n=1 Tax=Microbacterium sp. TaxID=51671 RepID=UPI00283843B9|nr:MFS transporter [Microbacterium sp.]MDR2321068.1 MFS transporter [Microbacterium sp.]
MALNDEASAPIITPAATAAPSRPRLGTLAITLPTTMIVLFMVWTAVPSILLPVQVQALTGSTDAGALAIASVLGTVAAAIANPVFGHLSDRTRSRFGRRTPWIVVGAVSGAAVLLLQVAAPSIAVLGLCWAATCLTLNAFQAAFMAVVPDRVPTARIGLASSLIGTGLNAGVLVGSLMFVVFPGLAGSGGYALLAILIVAVAVLFVVVSPDTDSRALPREPFRLGEFFATFGVSPRRYPDFAWVFIARVLLMLGYFLLFAFLMFALQDYVGLAQDQAVPQAALLFAINGAASVVGSILAAPIADRSGRLKVFVLIAGAGLAVSLVIPLVQASMVAMYVFAVVNGIAFGIYMSVDTALVNRVLPRPEDAAKDLGIMNLGMVIPQVLSASIGAIVVSFVGYAGLFAIAAVIAVVGALAILPVRKVV